MLVKLCFLTVITIVPFIQGSPMNMAETSKSASPGQVIELILNVVNFAGEVKKRLTNGERPSTVINIREAEDESTAAAETIRFRRSHGNQENVNTAGMKRLVSNFADWRIGQWETLGVQPKIADTRACIHEKEQQLIRVVQDVRREVMQCIDVSRPRRETSEVTDSLVEQDHMEEVVSTSAGDEAEDNESEVTLEDAVGDLQEEDESTEKQVGDLQEEGESTEKQVGDLQEEDESAEKQVGDMQKEDKYDESTEKQVGDLQEEEESTEKKVGGLQEEDESTEKQMGDLQEEEEYDESTEKQPDELLMGRPGCASAGGGCGIYHLGQHEDNEEDATNPKMTGNTSNNMTSVLRDEKVDFDMLPRFEQNVVESQALGINTAQGETVQRTKLTERTPKTTNNIPPASEPTALQSSFSRADCVPWTIQIARKKIDSIVRQISYCYGH